MLWPAKIDSYIILLGGETDHPKRTSLILFQVADASGVVEEELIPPGPAVDTESRPDARPVEAARPLPAAAVAHQPPAPRARRPYMAVKHSETGVYGKRDGSSYNLSMNQNPVIKLY